MQTWGARIMVAGVVQQLGCFDDEADGAHAYDAAVAAQNLHYPWNFPDDSSAKQAAKSRDNRSATQTKKRRKFDDESNSGAQRRRDDVRPRSGAGARHAGAVDASRSWSE